MTTDDALPFPTIDKAKPPPQRRDWWPVVVLAGLSAAPVAAWMVGAYRVQRPMPSWMIALLWLWLPAWWYMERRVDNRFGNAKVVGRLALGIVGFLALMFLFATSIPRG